MKARLVAKFAKKGFGYIEYNSYHTFGIGIIILNIGIRSISKFGICGILDL